MLKNLNNECDYISKEMCKDVVGPDQKLKWAGRGKKEEVVGS